MSDALWLAESERANQSEWWRENKRIFIKKLRMTAYGLYRYISVNTIMPILRFEWCYEDTRMYWDITPAIA